MWIKYEVEMDVGTERTVGKFKSEIVGKNAPTALDGDRHDIWEIPHSSDNSEVSIYLRLQMSKEQI